MTVLATTTKKENAHLYQGSIYCIYWWLVDSWQNAGHSELFSPGEWHSPCVAVLNKVKKTISNICSIISYPSLSPFQLFY